MCRQPLVDQSLTQQQPPKTDESMESTASTASIDTAETIETPSRRRSTKVKFSTIEIRKYNKVLGDNPACSSGAPTQLDWDYSVLPTKTIDDYEENRLPRRRRVHLALTPITRRNSMHYHFGYSHEEIDEAAEAIKKIKKQRQSTKKLKSNGHKERTQEVVQNVTRRIKRTFSKEKIYYKSEWEQYRNGAPNVRDGVYVGTRCVIRPQQPLPLTVN